MENMSQPEEERDPTDATADCEINRNTMQKKRFQHSSIKTRLPNMIQNLIRPGNVPFHLGLKEPASRADESPGECHDVIEMSVSKIIHHDENAFQFSFKVSMQFYAVDHSIGQCLPLTASLNSSKTSHPTPNVSSCLISSDDGSVFHEINADICVDYTELLSRNTLLLFELTGSSTPFVGVGATRGRKAWAFFRPERLLADFLSEGKSAEANSGTKHFDTELQLYKWQKESLLVRKQAEQHILRKNAVGHPEVFIQYLLRRKKKYNSCICLRVKPATIVTSKIDVEESKDP